MRTQRNRAVLATFALALIFSEAWAVRPYTPLHPDPVLEPWRWRSFPELNGLGLRCLAEAKDRAMWFGVDDGARRYDGVHWTAYTEKDGLYGAPVGALCATRDGSIYAGTAMGISRFNDGKWTRVFPPEGDLPWPVWDLMEARDGSVWAGTVWGALRLSREGSTLYTTEQMGAALRVLASYVRLSIVPDKATPARPYGEGIGAVIAQGWPLPARIPGVVWALAPGGPGEAAGLKVGDQILSQETSGDLAKLTVQREGRAKPFQVTVPRRQVEGTYREFPIYDVYEGRDGAMWFGLLRREIVRYTPSTPDSEWRLYAEKDGLETGYWPRIGQSRDGAIWRVSEHGGVKRFDGTNWVHLHSIPSATSILETRDGTLWVGGGGLHALRDGVWHTYSVQELSIPSHRTRLLEASDGALWVAGLGQEAVRLDYGTARWTTYENLSFLCETPDRAQWFISQDNGVVRYDGRGWTRYGVEDGLMDAPARLIVTRQGVLWAAGSHDSTAATARFDGRKWSLQTHPRLSWGIIGSILQTDDSSVWVSTGKGVSHFDGQTWTTYALPTDLRGELRQSRDGALWINQSPPEGKTQRIRTIRYQPDAVPPQTEITLSLDKVSQPGNTTLAWTGVSPYKATPDEEVQYSYRMDGGEWSPFSHEKNRVFLSLPSGGHTFEVRARDRDFNVDPTPAAIRFTVVPPVYRQPWFIGLMAVLLGAIGFQTTRVIRRDRRLKEANAALSSANKDLFSVNRELQGKTEALEASNRQLAEANAQIQQATQRKSAFLASMSHELRTPMNAIIGFTSLVLRRGADQLSERHRDNLTKVKLSADHLLSLINDILDLSKVEAGRVDIKPVRFEVKDLIASCCATVSPLVRPGVALNYEVTDGVGEAHTDEARLRQIVINLLSNALKFTEKGEVRVKCQVSSRT